MLSGLLKRKPIVTNIDITFPDIEPTIFEERMGHQTNRKIASSHVDGMGMRLSAYVDNATTWFQLEDVNNVKLAGSLRDLEHALEAIKDQLG